MSDFVISKQEVHLRVLSKQYWEVGSLQEVMSWNTKGWRDFFTVDIFQGHRA